MPQPEGRQLEAIRDRRAQLREKHLREASRRPATTARGLHHAALICRDLEETIVFYQDLLGFPLVELVENRDYAGSSHFFFDIGNRNLLGFFDFPGHDHPPFSETIGGVQHIAISVTPERFAAAKARLDAAGIPYLGPDRGVENSLYLRDPNGLGIELYNERPGVFEGEPLTERTGAERLVRVFYDELWNAWDDGRVEEVLDESFRFRGSLGRTTVGRDEWRSYRDSVRASSADFHNEVVTLLATGDEVVARLRYTGTHTGPLLGVPATGRRFAYEGAAFFTAARGRLTSAWVLGDLDGLRRQLS